MATTQEEIRAWLENPPTSPVPTHMVVICDTYDWEDFPKYIHTNDIAGFNEMASYDKLAAIQSAALNLCHGTTFKVMEVYSLTGKHSIDEQLKEHRAFHHD